MLLLVKLATLLCLLAGVALVCLGLFRDPLSLLYWRLRHFNQPRATGSGPRDVMLPSASSAVQVRLSGISEDEWKVSHDWVPRNQSLEVTSRTALITLGCWWDNFGIITALPTDTNGSFVRAFDRRVGLAHAPVQIQVAFQSPAAFGSHVITPPRIGARGDGHFLVIEVAGLHADFPVRDSGQSRTSHPLFGPGDPASITSITVSTDGVAAQAGDLAVAMFAMDPCDNPDIQIDLPEGWTSIGFNNVALQNLGYRACCRLVTQAGRQSATCSWSDGSTFVAEAILVIFKAASSHSP